MIAESTRSSGSIPTLTGMYSASPPVRHPRRRLLAGTPVGRVAPAGRDRQARIDRLARRHGQQVRPRSGHDLDQLVAAAACEQPFSSAVWCASSCTMSAARRCASTLSSRWASGSSRWLSQPCWLTSTSGRNERSSGGTTASRRAASRIAGARGSGRRRPRTRYPRRGRSRREPGAGEQGGRVLVQADRQHPGVVVERRLHPVAVVYVEIHVRDPLGAASSSQRIAIAGSL